MEPGVEDLLEEAKKCESEVLSTFKFSPAHVTGGLDELLKDAYAIRCPKPTDYFNRKDLIRIFNVIAKEAYGNRSNSPVVEGYGSFVMDMFFDGSDLDLSINFGKDSNQVPRPKQIETLRKFAKKFRKLQRKGIVRGIQSILTARVPIVKVIDCGTGIECDLSVDNRDGIVKSHIIHAISLIDDRFQKLSFLMKFWAKAHNINSSKDHTLNSLSIVSLVALHLQTRNPPILPPFSALLKDGSDPAAVRKVVDNYKSFGQKNVESLAELFITLFIMLASVEKLWEKGLCASLDRGAWICKSWGSRSYAMSVEDFTDQSENVARAVGRDQVKTIYRHIHESLGYFSDFQNGMVSGTKLIDLVFGGDTLTSGLVGAGDIDKTTKDLPLSGNQLTLERQGLAKKYRVKQIKKPRGRGDTSTSALVGAGDIGKTTKDIPLSGNQRLPKKQKSAEKLEVKQIQKSKGDTPTSGLVGAGDIGKTTKDLPLSGNQHPPKKQRSVENSEVKQIQKSKGDTPTKSLVGEWNIVKGTEYIPHSRNEHPPKRQRVVENLGVKQTQKPNEGNYHVQRNLRAESSKGPALAHQAGVFRDGTFQSHAIPSYYNNLSLGYGPGIGPSASAQNHFRRSFDSNQLSNAIHVLNSIAQLGVFHQQAVHPSPSLGPIHPHHPLQQPQLQQSLVPHYPLQQQQLQLPQSLIPHHPLQQQQLQPQQSLVPHHPLQQQQQQPQSLIPHHPLQQQLQQSLITHHPRRQQLQQSLIPHHPQQQLQQSLIPHHPPFSSNLYQGPFSSHAHKR